MALARKVGAGRLDRMGDDLFSAAAEDRRASVAPLAERLRPARLADVVGQTHLLQEGGPLRAMIDTDRVGSLVLWGPPGTGKTTLARLIAKATKRHFVARSAVTSGVKDIREVMEQAQLRLGEQGTQTILFLDEVHRFSRSQQDALLPGVEDGTVSFIGATTENPYFEVNAPLLSRATLFRLEPLSLEALVSLARRGCAAESVTADDEALSYLADLAGGDGRALLTTLEVAVSRALARSSRLVNKDDVAQAASLRRINYGTDGHFDIVSAFIKSIRGSDVDAGLYWLARMINAGEDPVFIARRLVILASEDVGMADSLSLVVATASAEAVRLVGLPESGLNLAHAVAHLASAPKSNAVTTAWFAALADAREGAGAGADVPVHLRDGHYSGAKSLGHGEGYQYPHDFPGNWVEQQYRPDGVHARYYHPPS